MNNKPFFITTVLAIAFCLIFSSSIQAQKSADKSKIAVSSGKVYEIIEIKMAFSSDQMTDFVFLDDNGTERTLRELVIGKCVFLNFWGT